jgi:p21-activated kinase 1
MLGFMTDFLNSNKRPEISNSHKQPGISTAYDPAPLTHVGFNLSTGKFTGLPKESQQLLQDSGISKSDQEKNPLAVMEIVRFYQEGGGDVWDKMGHAPVHGISPPPPIPGAAPAAYPGAPTSVNTSAEESRNSPNADDAVRSQVTVASNGAVAERPAPRPPTVPQQRSVAVASLAKAAGATLRRREKKKEDKANDVDIISRLQQICTDADPTRLYRNLVKIGQG